MNNLNAIYERILEVLQNISEQQLIACQRRQPKMTDLELVSLSLTSEYLGIDSENDLFRKLPKTLLAKIERSVYNRRRRRLACHIEDIRSRLAFDFNEFEDVFIVDSMPLEVCKLSRSGRSTICRENQYSQPDKGYCAAQSSTYYGYKLHAVCSVRGVSHSIDLSPASVHDINYLKDIKAQLNDCTLIGDKGYLSAKVQLNLFQSCNIKLSTPMRTNQYDHKRQPFVFRKSRKRIETLFSQLCDQFMIRRNYAKSFEGFKTRILSKITALTVVQYINRFIFERNINNIKISIV
ncbi:IS982 family transposase [Seonamhaeicola aphaedonensis]|uniref:DDE family transposase n=1 Tax=Seonamhaeicola aphaedonensis TaxID=1461338 RepID=A0A3D9HMH9_9FLAO|nr:IS982 family transposase [Seonamhaeicola aphaedonensis]RED50106.1 DDE family transposase [Seonamhaeicola aphaedonensis]